MKSAQLLAVMPKVSHETLQRIGGPIASSHMRHRIPRGTNEERHIEGTATMAMTGFEAITPEQREEFHREGILLIRGALTEEHRFRLEAAVDRVYAQEREAGRLKPDGTLHLLGFLDRDEAFGELLTQPSTFPYVWGLAGWNIYSHHNHLDVTPPNPSEEPPGWGWHQDGYRQNSDPES